MLTMPKAIYRFNIIPTKIPMIFFTGIEKIILKFTRNHKRPQRANVFFSKKNKDGVITLIDIKIVNIA
jgi:hypothetical protein